MDDLLNDPKVHTVVVAMIAGLGGWFVKREVRRIDKGLENAVHRSELDQLRKEIDKRHAENRRDHAEFKQAVTDDLTEIKETVGITHRRIDDLYQLMAKNGNGSKS